MNRLFFLMIISLYFTLHRCLSLVALFFTPLFSFTRKRFLFEWRYRNQQKPKGPCALCAHVSSQGELEQVRPFVDDLLESGESVQVLFTSPSVEKDLLSLKSQYPKTLFISALPLLTACLSSPLYNTFSNKFMMVRYDFFPELLLRALRLDSTLLFATLKGKKLGLFNRFVFNCFKNIIVARQKDKVLLERNGYSVASVSDFRALRIDKRLSNESNVLRAKSMQEISEFIKNSYKNNSLVFGSTWVKDIELFGHDLSRAVNNREYFVCLCPHKINNTEVDTQKKLLEKKGLRVVVLYKDATFEDINKALIEIKTTNAVLLSAIPGMLCEFYKSFKIAYVAGGFGRSIHSVLEPYLAECFVLCGPKTHRSTEFDLILENDNSAIKSISNEGDFFESVQEFSKRDFQKELVQSKIEEVKIDYQKIKESLL